MAPPIGRAVPSRPTIPPPTPSRSAPARRWLWLSASIVVLVLGAGHRSSAQVGPDLSVAAVSDRACRSAWVVPVDAAVIDPFRPPSDPYGPGNRGLQYGTEPGQTVSAVAVGVVAFSGPVGGAPVVVVDHGGGLRSTYSRLLGSAVDRGQRVGPGQVIASADAGFHLGARVDGRYIDPAGLLERLCLVVRLVPH